MRSAVKFFSAAALAAGLQFTVAHAQTTPPAAAPDIRPGNDIGTRSSLPLSPVASNITPSDTKSTIAPTPPEPNAGPDANAKQLLMAGQQALAKGQTGTADEALEQAETHLLSRTVPQTQTNYSNQDPTVAAISQARMLLGAGNKAGTAQAISQILASGAPELTE